jgi:hypothetical protein
MMKVMSTTQLELKNSKVISYEDNDETLFADCVATRGN